MSNVPLTPDGNSSINWLGHIRASGAPASLPLIRQTVVEAAEQCGFDDENVAKIEMAVGEACTNIIEHSYATQPLKLDIEVKTARYDNRLEIIILDYSSINFAVDQMAAIPLDDYLSTGRKRGLGLYIIQSFVDKVEHRFVCGQGNELKLVKYFA